MSEYRDDLHAAHERIERLERELVAANETIAEHEQRLRPLTVRAAIRGWFVAHRRTVWRTVIAIAIGAPILAAAMCLHGTPDCMALANRGNHDYQDHVTLCEVCNDAERFHCAPAAQLVVGIDAKRAIELYTRGCKFKDATSCMALSRLDGRRRTEWLRAACDLREDIIGREAALEACALLGR